METKTKLLFSYYTAESLFLHLQKDGFLMMRLGCTLKLKLLNMLGELSSSVSDSGGRGLGFDTGVLEQERFSPQYSIIEP